MQEVYWIEQVGGAQLLLPAHVVNEYCHEKRPFCSLPYFRGGYMLTRTRQVYGGIDWYDARCGKEWAMYRDCLAVANPMSQYVISAESDKKAIATLLMVRQEQREDLGKTLSESLTVANHPLA